MNRHTEIRNAILDRLATVVDDNVSLFDGLPAVVDAGELPALAVWLTDAQYTAELIDEDSWQAILHVAVFMKAENPDGELDAWMEEKIYPALTETGQLNSLIDTMTPRGYDYQRDSEMATWAMAEITYLITYTM